MRLAAILPLAATAASFMLPDESVFAQLDSEEKRLTPEEASAAESLEASLAPVYSDIDSGPDAVFDWEHGADEDSDLTIYQLVSRSEHTTKFARLLDDQPDLVQLLNSTETDLTLFVPIDAAFDHINGELPSGDRAEALLSYHVGLGLYPSRRLLATHTLPTVLRESFLGGEHQRLRTSVGVLGTRINFYGRVVGHEVRARNGVVHGVDRVLEPPPMVGRVLSLLPDQFSTLLLAYERTEFVRFVHGLHMDGSTVFAPSNGAFSRLGRAANAFLFNTDDGVRYLRALLKYQIAPNATLYSDAFYRGGGASRLAIANLRHYHVDLPTLLHSLDVAVDVYRLGGFTHLRVNERANVVVSDAIAKNGVIHVVDRVPIPPRKGQHGASPLNDLDSSEEIDVEDLKARLEDYLDEDDGIEDGPGDL